MPIEFVDKQKIYKRGSNEPGIFNYIKGKEGLWYVKSGELDNGVTNKTLEPKNQYYKRLNEDEPNYLHYKNIGAIVEAYASKLYNELTPHSDEKLSIEIISGKTKEGAPELQIASKLIPTYRGIEEIIASGKKITLNDNTHKAEIDGKSIKGINRNFILRYLLGDFDVANMQNIGLVEKEDHFEGQSIDFGKAFLNPATALVHSTMSQQHLDFMSVVTNPAAPSWIFLFTNLMETDSKSLNKIINNFKNNASEGQNRIQPGIIPPIPEEAIYPLPESIGSAQEVTETLKHISSIDVDKLKIIAKEYEEFIVKYITKNNLPVEYQEGTIINTIIDRIALIRSSILEKDNSQSEFPSAVITASRVPTPPQNRGSQL